MENQKSMCDSNIIKIDAPDYGYLYGAAIEDAKKLRDEKIKASIMALLSELNEIENQIRQLEKKKKKIAGRLTGYSKGQVEQVQEEPQQ